MCAVGMRVRVLIGRASVGGPAGVPDARRSIWRVCFQELAELGQATDALANRQLSRVSQHRDASRVVAAVFEPLKAFHEEWDDRRGAGVPHDSAHPSPLLLTWYSPLSA